MIILDLILAAIWLVLSGRTSVKADALGWLNLKYGGVFLLQLLLGVYFLIAAIGQAA